MTLQNRTFRAATIKDLPMISKFVDYWIAGRGKKKNAPGATNDYFITKGMHTRFIEKYHTWLMFFKGCLVGWAVIHPSDQLIQFLIAGTHRNHGLGSVFIREIKPYSIRSRSNQQSGNPNKFYEKNGYKFSHSVTPKSRINQTAKQLKTKRTIDIYVRK